MSLSDLHDIASKVLERVPHGEGEVIVDDRDKSLTRFADNGIHQNVADNTTTLRLRIVHDGRVGIATVAGNVWDKLDDLVAAAERARSVSPAGEVDALPDPGPETPFPAAFASATATASPELRADAVAVITGAAEKAGLRAYGALDTGVSRLVIHNSRGLRREAESTRSGLVAVCRGDQGGGYAERSDVNVTEIDAAALASEVVDTCKRNQNAVPIEPGDYEVVLSSYAVTEMLQHLSWMGFSGLSVEEERSFMRPGEKLMSDLITIYDDPAEREGAPYPFDAEGNIASRVVLVDKGVCRDVVHDSASARRAGIPSTGHALPMPNTDGGYTAHLAMAPGDQSIDELISGVKDGLYVTRFWYVRDVHPLKTMITGMTREGTFHIRNGKLCEAVKDLRFTQSIVDALAGTLGVSRERLVSIPEWSPGWDDAVIAPAVRLRSFTFSS